MKRKLSFFIAMVMALSITACGLNLGLNAGADGYAHFGLQRRSECRRKDKAVAGPVLFAA